MKNRIALFMMMMSFYSWGQTQAPDNKIYDLVIGTYTSKYPGNGIYVYQFNTQTGDFSFKSKTEGVSNPSFLVVSQDRKHVFSVSEAGAGKGGVSAFNFNPVTGKLNFVNSVSSGGDGPCYVTVDDKGKYVFAANYSGGSLAAIRVNDDGSLNADIQAIQHEGSSIVQGRQDKPHVHSAVLSPDNRFLFTPDLGTDKINVYRIDPTQGQPLKPADPAFVALKAGSGPRHFTFHPNGKFAYLVQEMDGAVTAFDYKDGKLEIKQTITMLSPDFTGNIGAADIHTSPDGKFLYASNRGDANEIVIYAIAKDGKLTYAGRQSTLGKAPRNFAIDPSGNFLLAANQDTDHVVIFKRDQTTGLLTPTGKKMLVGMPVCLKFVAIN